MDIIANTAFGLLHDRGDSGIPHLLDFTLSQIKYWSASQPVIEADSMEQMFHQAVATNKKYLLVQSIGHFIHNGDFWHSLEREIASEAPWLAIGHLLGKYDEHYYGLHPQCLFVNLEVLWPVMKYNTKPKLYPIWSDITYSPIPLPEVSRSPQNYHDDYTPHWAIPTGKTRDYTPSKPGWGLVAHSMELGLLLRNFDERARNAKLYLYPEETIGTKFRALGTMTELLQDRNRIYFWNTEPYGKVENPTELKAIYSVAAGLKTNWLLYQHGINGRTKVVYFDVSQAALEFKRHLVKEWDGKNYPEFLNSFRRDNLFGYQETPQNLRPEYKQLWAKHLEQFGGHARWLAHWELYRELEHHYIHCDLSAYSVSNLVKEVEPGPALMWWSNVWQTPAVHWLRGEAGVMFCYSALLDELFAKNPDLRVLGTGPFGLVLNCAPIDSIRNPT